MSKKPHRGKLDLWRRVVCAEGVFYLGIFDGHPAFHGTFGNTSAVVKESASSIETLNSRYSLGDPLPAEMSWDVTELLELHKARQRK